jgi:4,5-dihydroxyphthalate decarboxylase
MMLSGELDATLLYIVDPNLIDRSTADLWNHPDIKPLFSDAHAEGVRFYNKTGLYPINHGMVIKKEIVDKHPWVVLNVYKAFKQANDLAGRQRMAHIDAYIETGIIPKDSKASLANPLIQHGIVANRAVLETAAQYSHEQGLTPRLMGLDEVFSKNTMEQ